LLDETAILRGRENGMASFHSLRANADGRRNLPRPTVDELQRWAREHIGEVVQAQRRYGAAAPR
jgi:hypothetical protein